MRRNTEGLQHSAKRRSHAALERAQLTIRRMQAEETSINFRTVAAQAGVSTAWLYKTRPLRDHIMKLRHNAVIVDGESLHHRQQLSHERVVATLRFRIKKLEDLNRELKEQLEAAYGRLAVAEVSRRSNKRR